MKRTTIFIEPQLERELQALARRRGRPMAAIVREAVAQYVTADKERRPSRLSFVASGRSGRRDIAERHEDVLFQADPPAAPTRPRRRSPPRTARRRNQA
jgi:predicted transcriptional regulator